MKKAEKSARNKNLILRETEKLFAEKGYDGTRVDEIAARSGLNKALIYYYFNNKQGLLEALVQQHVAETIEFKETLLEEVSEYNESEIKQVAKKLYTFLEEKRHILSILTIETVKLGSHDKNIFELFHSIYEKTLQDLDIKQEELNDSSRSVLHLFFFGAIPVTIFLALRDKWSEYYQVDPTICTTIFQQKFEEIYVEIYQELIARKTTG